MFHSMSRTGIFLEKFFLVEGDLVEPYNKALEIVIGKRTQHPSFHIDKRGESPELEEEFGKNYLQSGAAHRYCIIVSPDQKDADLIHEEFSFDQELFDLLYTNSLAGISLATRVDGMYGEIDDDVREFESVEDVLLINTIHLELHTPSKFMQKARTLQGYVSDLQTQPDLLIQDDSALPKKILQLVKDVGDVRGYNLQPVQATKEVKTFYTRLFGGVSVFRESEKQAKTVVMYRETDYHPEDGPTVQFLRLQDKEDIIRFFVEHTYADYTYTLLEPGLSRLEDETLLSKGYDVTEMGKEQKIQALYTSRESMLPVWYEFKELKRQVTKGHQFSEIVRKYSAEVQSMLLMPGAVDKSTSDVVEHVLTRLCDVAYEKMYAYNRRHLEQVYISADENKRKYILQVLTGQSKNQTVM